MAEGIFSGYPERPRLRGSRCRRCHATTFPVARSCARCTGEDTEDVDLAPRGTLWGFTVQGFPPKAPYVEAGGPFRPFGVGYVDLGDVLVEARLRIDGPTDLAVGQPVELVLEPLTVAATGEVVMAYAFAPCPDPDGEEDR